MSRHRARRGPARWLARVGLVVSGVAALGLGALAGTAALPWEHASPNIEEVFHGRCDAA